MITGLQIRAAMGVCGLSQTGLSRATGISLAQVKHMISFNGIADRDHDTCMSVVREYFEGEGIILTCRDGFAGIEAPYDGPHIDGAEGKTGLLPKSYAERD